jgi:hypothetical protein
MSVGTSTMSDPSSAIALKVPLLNGNYSTWKPSMSAHLQKMGTDNVHLTPIKNYVEMEKKVAEWDVEELNDAFALVLGVGSKSSSSSSSSSPPTSSSSKGVEVKAEAASTTIPTVKKESSEEEKAVEEAKKKIRTILYKSRKAFGILYEALPIGLKTQVDNLSTIPNGYAYALWEFLEKKYQNTESDNVAELYRQWNDLKMNQKELFDDYMARVDQIHGLLVKAGKKIDADQYLYKALFCLRDEYNVYVSTWQTSGILKDASSVNYIEIRKNINTIERRMYKSDQADERVAGTFDIGGVGIKQQLQPSGVSSNVKCFNCGEQGHIKKYCPKLKKIQSGGANNTQDNRPSCEKCKSKNHLTKDHDDNKVPHWKRVKLGMQQTKAAAAVGTTVPTGNRYNELSNNDEDQSHQQPEPAGQTNRVSMCALVCGTGITNKQPVQSVKPTPKTVSIAAPPVPVFADWKQKDLPKSLKKGKWGIDTMASISICGDRSKFSGPLLKIRPIEVKVADGSVVSCTEQGSVIVDSPIIMSDNSRGSFNYKITKVLYHPSFPINLISWCSLRKMGWKLSSSLDSDYMLTSKKNKILLESDEDVLIWNTEDDSTKLVCAFPTSPSPKWTTVNDLVVLHQRLDHMGFDAMIKMIKGNKVDGIGKLDIKDEDLKIARDKILSCTSCIQGKGSRTAFGHRGLDKGTAPIEVINIDSYVHTLETKSGRKWHEYGVTISCPYTDHMSSVVCKTKEPITGLIIDVLNKLQRQSGKKIKRIYCDGGGEFINEELQKWCSSQGVELHWPPPETPQLNGSSERHVRIHKDGTRTLMVHSGLPDRFWNWALLHFVSVWNRSHICERTGMTPYEALYGRRSSIQHLAVLGCDAYYHVPKKDRTSIKPKMEPCIYLGHDHNRSSSIVYRLREKDYIHTRDIRVRQNKFQFAKAVANGTESEILNIPAGEIPPDFDSLLAEVADIVDNGRQLQGGVLPQDVAQSEEKSSPDPAESKSESKSDLASDRDLSEEKYADDVDQPDNIYDGAEIPRDHPMHTNMQTRSQTREKLNEVERQAIEDALAFLVMSMKACSATTGMHELEKQTPKSYKEALLHPKRRE